MNVMRTYNCLVVSKKLTSWCDMWRRNEIEYDLIHAGTGTEKKLSWLAYLQGEAN